jgi:hypothetical protein
MSIDMGNVFDCVDGADKDCKDVSFAASDEWRVLAGVDTNEFGVRFAR